MDATVRAIPSDNRFPHNDNGRVHSVVSQFVTRKLVAGRNGKDGSGSTTRSHRLRTVFRKLESRGHRRSRVDQILDGATALYPVYAAFVQAAYDRSAYSRDVVRCTKTSQAYRSIIDGSCDIIFVLEPSESQKAAAKAAGADLVLTPIGREAFVFLVGDENPVNDISVRQIRNIYSGKTARWSTLGWEDGGNIIAFQRPDGSGSQTGLQKIMGDLPIIVPQPLPDESLIGTNSLTQQITVRWNGVQPALGYSYKFYATTMYSNPHAKLLSVNGIAPTDENIRNGTYPFVFTFYAVTNGRPEGAEKEFIDWILSDQGSELIQKTGYTPINA